MRIISLNTYFGCEFDALMEFVVREAGRTDAFCFQEMLSNAKEDVAVFSGRGRANLLQEMARRLPEFAVEFAPMQDDFECVSDYAGQVQFGNAIFYRVGTNTTNDKRPTTNAERGSFFVYNALNSFDASRPERYETLGHNAVWIALGSGVTILTTHGNSQPGHKLDTPKRLEQSRKIVDFLRDRPGEKIVMGDFNLMPDTESIRMFESSGYRNLIREYKIVTTRGTRMRALFPEYEHGPYGFQEFADYAFVTPGVTVRSFEVPDIPVSDHLPMILEIA